MAAALNLLVSLPKLIVNLNTVAGRMREKVVQDVVSNVSNYSLCADILRELFRWMTNTLG